MRIFKNKWFSRFARKERIADDLLCDAVERAEQGQIDADLGGWVIKQRIARPEGGRSGAYRSIIVFKRGRRAFFVYGFAKSSRADLQPDEAKAFKLAAKELLAMSEAVLDKLTADGVLPEVDCDD